MNGSGRYCELNKTISLADIVNILKTRLKLNNLLLAKSHTNKGVNEPVIRTIAVCPGSGQSLFKTCQKSADLWITGEMSHHDILDATENIENPTSVILTAGHSNSERGFLLDVYKPWLENELKMNEVEIMVSESDCDPLTVV